MGALNASSTLYFTRLHMELQGPAGRGRGKIGVYILTEIQYTIYAIQLFCALRRGTLCMRQGHR